MGGVRNLDGQPRLTGATLREGCTGNAQQLPAKFLWNGNQSKGTGDRNPDDRWRGGKRVGHDVFIVIVVTNIGASQLGERVQRFVAVYRSELASRVTQIATVDARYANGIAVGWRTESTEPESDEQPDARPQTRLALNTAVNHSRAEDGVR